MEKYKQQIIDRGYSVVAETEDGIAFANESASFSVILLKEYFSNHRSDAKAGHDLHRILKEKFWFAEKSTICVIASIHEDEGNPKEEIERNEYYFLKIFPEKIHILPQKQNKDIKIVFSPMENEKDTGDYCINPFDNFDGLCSANYLEYLSRAKDGDVIKYPKIISGMGTSFLNYWAYKLYQTEIQK